MNAGDIAIQNLSIARRVLLDPYGLDEAHLRARWPTSSRTA